MTSTTLSSRKYSMLQTFNDMPDGEYMTIEQAQAYDQRPFRSMLIQQWVSYRARHGFYITKLGRAAMQSFLHTDIARKDTSARLTAYFDKAFGQQPAQRKARVVSVSRQQEAAA